jgi:hypothetical protein
MVRGHVADNSNRLLERLAMTQSQSSLRCPHCRAETIVAEPPAAQPLMVCPQCGQPLSALPSDEHQEVYPAQLADKPTCAPINYRLIPWWGYTLAAMLLLVLVGGLIYYYQQWHAGVASKHASADVQADSTSRDHANQAAKSDTSENEQTKHSNGLPLPPSLPVPPSLPKLDAEVARSVVAEKQQQLIGTWYTDLPYPITIVYSDDGQVRLTAAVSPKRQLQVSARWRLVKAINHQVVTVEWEADQRPRQRFDVVFEQDGDIQHPIWGQPRLIPRFNRLK